MFHYQGHSEVTKEILGEFQIVDAKKEKPFFLLRILH